MLFSLPRALFKLEIATFFIDNSEKFKLIKNYYNSAFSSTIHYNNIEKVEELLSFGDMSCLEEKIHPSGIHNFKISENGVTVFYGRDRGDSNVDAQVTSIEEFESKEFTTCIDYLYLLSEGKWFVKSLIDRSGWKLVTDSLLELALM